MEHGLIEDAMTEQMGDGASAAARFASANASAGAGSNAISPHRKSSSAMRPSAREFWCGLALITVLGMVASMRGGPNAGMAATQVESPQEARAPAAYPIEPKSVPSFGDLNRNDAATISAQEKTRSE